MSDDGRHRAKSDRLARRLAEPSSLRRARRLQREGLLGPSTVTEPESTAVRTSSPTPRAISIWAPRRETDGSWVFERPASGVFSDHYAERRRIPRHRSDTQRRICLFGESAAAGYLYAPHLTPAMVLERHLAALSTRASIEVLDFSRTNETLDALLETLASSLQLTPDALVVFAGNNWPLLEQPRSSPYAPSIEGRLGFAERVRRGGLAGAADDADRALLHRVGAALGEIERLAAGIPVVLVVPEVNLRDWQNRQPVCWLPGDGVRRWYELYGEASLALARNDGISMNRVAQRLLELDGGSSPTTWRLMALAHLTHGDEENATAACRQEIAVSDPTTMAFLSAPRITPMLQEILRRGSRHHGFASVDLPRIFARHTGSPLTDRRLFLDYCHLTREGMKVAMAATAREILQQLEPSATMPDLPELVAELPDPQIAPQADATTKLGAAIHTAHRLLSVSDATPLLEHWCREALAASEGVAELMLDLVDARSAPCPTLLTAAQGRSLRSRAPLTPQHGWCWDGLDLDVLGAIVSVLRERGRELGDEVDRRLLAQLPGNGTVDLTEGAACLRRPLERFLPEVMRYSDLTGRGFFRAAWPTSRFVLLGDGRRGAELEATLRIPSHSVGERDSRDAVIRLEVNGTAVSHLPTGPSWQRSTVSLPADLLRLGPNEIAIRWPWPMASGERALEDALARFELGREAEIHPVFGEIFSLRAALRQGG